MGKKLGFTKKFLAEKFSKMSQRKRDVDLLTPDGLVQSFGVSESSQRALLKVMKTTN